MSPVSGNAPVPRFLNALGLARQGIDHGLRSLDAIAQAVARDQVAFAARLMTTADQMLGTLLDVRA